MSEAEAAVESFQRIVAWLAPHPQARAVIPSFRPPPSAESIAEFETKTKLKLPDSLLALYRLHDGQSEDAAIEANNDEYLESGLFPGIESSDLAFVFVPIAELTEGTIADTFGFRKGWVPFGSNYGGDHVILDLASDAPPQRGRVLIYNHEYNAASPLAPSFGQYLRDLADGMESGEIVWSERGLSYAQERKWDDLIDERKVEYDPDFLKEYGDEDA